MQRAAASSPPSSPANPSEPSLKRRKTSNGPSPATTHITDTQAFRDAADADDAKRTAAVEKLAAEAGETKWVLSTADVNAGPTNETAPQRKLRFLRAGYSDIDQDTAQLTGKGWGEMGRRSFGRFNRDIEVILSQQCIHDENSYSKRC